ncbi:MAG: glycosyltransferase family 4 protein [Mesorhizobium sp.]|uniref:glycosyltransferase family 4 protein n=2 Tax=Mesorhizobium sp. TaxID=1871066 RepID=UPI000FE55B26|nr:glycosyltransferase family 4 protein [Mesorhizobium sp.]RWB36364.1 MAG: glycosyltransferase family 1 protein [Mesorhizobium sp.]RWD48885.1 MAG: glycosyltransferase family 1 protein [Mesorhizobium sp.]TIT17023.1 MAG: glycosyltransferase family 4 protein [Mesorhizobium sp.]
MISQPPHGIILMTYEYHPFPGGIGTYAGRLVEIVRAGGHAATVIAPAYPDLPADPQEPDTHRILRHHQISPFGALRALSILRNVPKDRLFLAADIRSVLLTFVLRPFHRRGYRAMIHGSEVSKFRTDSILFRFVRRAYEGADVVFANSHATLRIFSESFGMPRKGVVTYLGVDPMWFQPIHGNFEHPQLAAVPQAASVICAVGRIEPRKGQLETVRAIASARDEYGLDNPIFVMAGRAEDQAYVSKILDEAARARVPVIATGRLSDDDLKRLYRRAACHTLFARELQGKIEGFGLVLVEAGAQGCPSIATAVGGIPEVMGSTGVLVPPEDVNAMARAIATYVANAELRERDGALAKSRARTFDWATCAGATFPELNGLSPRPK